MEERRGGWGEQMKSGSLFSRLPPYWVASNSWVPLPMTPEPLKTVVNLVPLYFRVLGKEADRTGNSLPAVLSLMASLDLILVNSVSINKLCSKYLILNVPRVSYWDPDWHNGYAFSLEDTIEYIPYNFIPHLLIINIYLNILPLWSWLPPKAKSHLGGRFKVYR